MKTVFSNSMCAHVWAQRSQPEGHSDSMRFDGDVLYSYQTPIANFTPEGIALISSHSYSNTTNRHQSEAQHAVRGKSFTVPDIGAGGGRARTVNLTGDAGCWLALHTQNLAWLVERYRETVARLMRVQSWTWQAFDDVLDSVKDAGCVANDYAETFGLLSPAITAGQLREDAQHIWDRCMALEIKRADPKYAAKTEKAREQREAAKARKVERERAARIQREVEQRSAWLSDMPAEMARAYGWRGTDEHGGAYLRVRGDNVETSLGASVPLSDARRVLRLIARERKKGCASFDAVELWSRDCRTLGHFTLDSWNEKGIRAGCHFISWSEIERIAPQLEVAP